MTPESASAFKEFQKQPCIYPETQTDANVFHAGFIEGFKLAQKVNDLLRDQSIPAVNEIAKQIIQSHTA